MDAPKEFSAPDNGGKLVVLSLAYLKEINVVTNNVHVMQLTCLFSEKFKIPQKRITDAYNGYCNHKSSTLPETPVEESAR